MIYPLLLVQLCSDFFSPSFFHFIYNTSKPKRQTQNESSLQWVSLAYMLLSIYACHLAWLRPFAHTLYLCFHILGFLAKMTLKESWWFWKGKWDGQWEIFHAFFVFCVMWKGQIEVSIWSNSIFFFVKLSFWGFGHLEREILNRCPPNHWNSSNWLKWIYLIISLFSIIKICRIKNLRLEPGNLN